MANNNGALTALVVFMGLSGALGASTYVGAKGASEMKSQAAALKQESSSLQSERSKIQSDFASLKESLGYPAVESADELQEQMRKDVEAALGSVDLNTSYRDALVSLGESFKNETAEKANESRRSSEAESLAQLHKSMTSQQQSEFDKTLGDLKTSHAKTLDDARASQDKLQDAFGKQTEALNALQTATKEEIQQKKQETADFAEAEEKLRATNERLSARVDELAAADVERADGVVVFADQVTKVVRLNLGAKDGVRPLVTFNVFPPDALNMTTDRAKGSVQVVRAINDRLCEAKILEDEMSNPIQSGDLVYTPLWRPGKVIRYALDYKLDVDGDGFSDVSQLVNLIQSSGAEVAAWIDDDGGMHGEIDDDVYALVYSPDDDGELIRRDFTKSEDERAKLQSMEAEYRNKAEAKGIRMIALPDFLAAIGYKETAKITRYREKNGVDLQDNGIALPIPTDNPIAPIYSPNADRAPTSTGIIAPIYQKESQPAPVSDGKVSDYYFRKRASKSE